MDVATIAPIERDRPTEPAELTVLNTGCGCGCDGSCGCGAVRAQPVADEARVCGCRAEPR
jgi:hypothetical protein